MNYRKFQDRHNLTNNDIIALVQSSFPKYSKVQHSMCCQPDKYGVKMLPAAERLVREKYAPRPNRKKSNHVSCRLDDKLYKRFSDFLKSRNISMQDLLEEIINAYLEVKEND